MRENSIYTITPPDMHLLDRGPSITVITTDDEFVKDVANLHESMFKTVPVNIYHTDGVVTEDNMAWLLSVVRLSDTVFVDLDTANDLGLITAMVSGANVAYINQDNLRSDIVKLFNAMREGYTVYESPQDYLETMLARFADI